MTGLTSPPPVTPEGVRVRRAAVKDFEAVSVLLVEIGRPAPTPETRGALRGLWERHLARPEAASLVAEDAGRILGYCTVEYRERLNYVTPEVWVGDLIVADAARRRGVGRALMEWVFREAAEKKAHRVRLESGHHRTDAHRFYERIGMEEAGRFFVWVPPRR